MKKSILIVLAAVVAVSLAACSSVAQEPLSNPEPLVSGEPIASSEPTASEPVSTGELSYSDLTDEQKALFGEIAPMFDEPVKWGNMSVEDASKELDDLISGLVEDGGLPTNAVDLFHQYRDEMGITFPEPEPQPEVVLNDGALSQPAQNQEQGQQQDISGDDYNRLPSIEEQQKLKESAGIEGDGYVDFNNGLWDDVPNNQQGNAEGEEFHKLTPEEQREIDISAGGDGKGSIITDWDF